MPIDLTSDRGPGRDDKRYSIYCPGCNRHGEMAGWRYMITGEEVPPEKLTCPECGAKVEVLGRADQ